MRLIPVLVVGSKISKTVYALLDGGANISVISKKLVTEIGAIATHTNTAIRVIGQSNPIAFCNQRISIQIETYPDREGEVRMVNIRTADGILKRPSHKVIKFASV